MLWQLCVNLVWKLDIKIKNSTVSIWDNKIIKDSIKLNFEPLSLDEGSTPVETLGDIFVKHEDRNPSGSWKDRGTAYKINELKNLEIKEGVLFSSGNALISFLEYSKLYPEFKLNCVVSNSIAENKLNLIKSKIKGTNNELFVTENPKKTAVEIAAKKSIPNLKISIDNSIVKGYWSLGLELGKLIKSFKEFKEGTINQNVGLFIQASSGTSAVGITEGLFVELEKEYLMPQIYICQTEQVHPFVNEEKYEGADKSLADAIVDTVGLRKEQINKIVKETNGGKVIINNEDLKIARSYYQEKSAEKEEASFTSLLSLAGYLKVQNEHKFSKVICIFSGR